MTKITLFSTDFLNSYGRVSTNAFRLYRLDRIEEKLFSQVKSDSYSFFFESLYLIHSNSISISETPIELGIRPSGDSKMSIYDAFTSLRILIRISFQKYFKTL